jgi:hypothetical protein
MVIVPPYWGLPSLSHQFPVTEVVDVVVGTDVEVTFVVGAGTDEEMGKGVDVEVDVGIEVDVLQDAKTSDVTMRQIITTQIAPLFI